MSEPVTRGGPTWWALPLILILAACTGGIQAQSTTTSVTIATSSTSAPATTSSTAAATTTIPLDPAAVVGESLAASSANYRFTSVVLVGEQTLTTINGMVDGTSVSAEVTTGSSELSYIRTPDGEWVTGPDGDWVQLEGEPPVGPPLGALVDATDLVLESGDGGRGVFTGTLGPAAGEAEGVRFSLTVEGGLVAEIRYEVDTGGETAQVITTFSDIGGAGAISPPEGV